MDKNIALTWDLDSLLKGKTLDDLYNDYLTQQAKVMDLYQTFLDTEENFIKFLNEQEVFIKLSNRLMNYLTNNQQEDISNPIWISWIQKVTNQAIEFNKLFSDYENKVIAHKTTIEKYLQNPLITEYKRSFELLFKDEKHLLSKESELLLAQINIYSNSNDDIFSTLTENDFTYKDAIDSKGNIIKINTQADVFKNLRSKDETLRKSSWYSFYETFYQYRNTLTKTLYYNYLTLNTIAKIRKFPNYIAQTAFNDEIPVSFISNLYERIKRYQPLNKKFVEYRTKYLKKMLNKNELDPWDLALELIDVEKHYSIDEVKEIALDSLAILGKEYQGLVQRAYDERWISFMPSPTKQTGAYSIGGTKGLDKYFISMNYDSTIQSIYTLVHELGHSMNSYYYGQAQKLYQDNSIFYAEIASINNEMILSHYLLNKYNDDLKMKLMILDEVITGFFNTTSRQIVFSNFEWLANEWVNKGEEFTYEKISSTYYDLLTQYLTVTKSYKEYCEDPYKYILITPLRISHFYMGNFYVYKYCTGQIAALIASDRLIKGKPNAKENLFNFLKSGTSLNPLETIKLLDIDLETDAPYEEAEKILSEWIDEFVEIVNKLLD